MMEERKQERRPGIRSYLVVSMPAYGKSKRSRKGEKRGRGRWKESERERWRLSLAGEYGGSSSLDI